MYLEIEGAERYRAALYIRLSREDETDGPSESVSNQRAMLEDFARQRGVPVAGLYVDDGWSGTSFNRPEFRRMLRDIEAGRVNMVITRICPAGARLHHDRPLYGALFPGTPCAVHLPVGRH